MKVSARFYRTSLNAICAVLLIGAVPQWAHAAGGSGGGLSQPSASKSFDPAKTYQEGLEALEAEDYKTADQKFKLVLSAVPDNPEANYYRGVARVGLDKHKSSVRYFKKAIKLRKTFVEAYVQLAYAYKETGKLDKADEQLAALQDLRTACETSVCTAQYTNRLSEGISELEAALGDETAHLSFSPRSAFLVDPNAVSSVDGPALYAMSIRLINQGQYRQAIEELYTTSSVYGPHPDISNYLGYSYRQLAQMDEALAYYSLALDLAPDHLGANEYLGELYVEIGALDKAERQLKKLDALCPFGCAEREDLARALETKTSNRVAAAHR